MRWLGFVVGACMPCAMVEVVAGCGLGCSWLKVESGKERSVGRYTNLRTEKST